MTMFILALTTACSVAPADSENPAELQEARALQISDPEGAPIDVQLLPGSSVAPGGDALYRVGAAERRVDVLRSTSELGPTYLEVTEDGALLAAAELQDGAVLVRGLDGSFASAENESLPVSDRLALALLDAENLEAFDRSLGVSVAAEGELGVARQALRIRQQAGGACPSHVTCCNLAPPIDHFCTCVPGQKCISTGTDCECKSASRAF
ncbi:MAG TPA: hypothetical protein VJU61_28130 [Polyangiaceae bacterium]|nr:hypothetical protein [Polyangiaceae bacterium]